MIIDKVLQAGQRICFFLASSLFLLETDVTIGSLITSTVRDYNYYARTKPNPTFNAHFFSRFVSFWEPSLALLAIV